MHQEEADGLREAGFTVGDYSDFLGLTPDETAKVESLIRLPQSDFDYAHVDNPEGPFLKVLLDGEEVPQCCEADSIEGWATQILSEVDETQMRLRKETLYGDVRILFLDEESRQQYLSIDEWDRCRLSHVAPRVMREVFKNPPQFLGYNVTLNEFP